MRLRTINQAYMHLKEKDSEMAVSKYLFREIVKQGKIHAMKSGNKYLVDIDTLEEELELFLKGGIANE